MAAVLACGPSAILSHRSAGTLWDLHASAAERVEVTTPTNSARVHTHIRTHRTRVLADDDRAEVSGIPCTSPARTLIDLAEVLGRRQLERACNQAEVLDLFDFAAVMDGLERVRGRRSATLLRRILADPDRDETLTRSDLEERFLALCHSAALPRPRVNAWVALGPPGDGVEVDFLWARQRVVAETDGRAFHSTRRAFESDRRRDQRLAAAGYTVVRFTWDQVVRRPHEVTATLSRLLNPP